MLGAQRMQVAAIRAAKRMGMRVIAIDPMPSAPGLALADESHVFDLGDVPRCIDVARSAAVAGVVTLAADYPMPTLAAMCGELSLPGPSPAAVERATNKRKMREAFVTAGVPGPRSIPVESREQARSAFVRLGAGVVVKPTLSNGGKGVTMVPHDAPLTCMDDAFDRALRETRADGALVEDFVDGPEFSVELLSWDGQARVVAVTDKITTGPPYFVEIGHSQPSQFDHADVESLVLTACSGMQALGLDWCAGHAEIRLSASGPQVMEIAGRLGGGFITTDLVPASTGIDIVSAAVRLAIGECPSTVREQRRGAAVQFLTGAPGRVVAVRGIQAAQNEPGCLAAEIYVRPGDEVIDLRDARGRIGHVICDGADAQHALDRTSAALEHISVETIRS